MTATNSDLTDWLDQLMLKEQVKHYKITLSGNTEKGDGYLGEITFVRIFATSPDKIYNLVVKSAKKSDELRKQTPLREAYNREIFMYTKVFPILAEYQRTLRVPELRCYPKCHFTCLDEYKEAVILNDIKFEGFELYDRQKVMNLGHAELVFRKYANYHGLSMALRKLKPALFDSLTKNMSDVFGAFFKTSNFIGGMQEDFNKLLTWLEQDGRHDIVHKYKGFEKDFMLILSESTKPQSKSSVILHGDCWNNNMMFKYEGGDKSCPIDLCLLDFQLSRVASPTFDLSYYLYACHDGSTLTCHFDYLLDVYHKELTTTLTQYNCDVTEILTKEELREEWKQYGRFGLCMAILIIKIELSDPTEAPSFEDAADSGTIDNMFDYEFKNQKLYEQRLKDVFIHFANKFL